MKDSLDLRGLEALNLCAERLADWERRCGIDFEALRKFESAFASTRFNNLRGTSTSVPLVTSQLAAVHEIGHAVNTAFRDLLDNSVEYTVEQIEQAAIQPQKLHGLWRGLCHTSTEERIDARIQALQYFGLAYGKEAERIARDFTKYWSNRLETLMLREILRSYLKGVLRLVRRVIKHLRRIRTPEFVFNLIVLQAPWCLIHGQHPPHKSAAPCLAPSFRGSY
jgi:hypothetical protein